MFVAMKRLFFCLIIILYGHLFSCAYDFAQYHVIDPSRLELYSHDKDHPYRELLLHAWIPQEGQQCPLILFSHGLGDNFNGMTYTRLCCYCASQGYVVVSVSHPYACKSIQFPDGRLAPFLFPAPFHQQPGKNMYDIEADWWLGDMICALNECIRQNKDATSLLYKKIDVSRIGVMGHSLGGSAVIQLGRRDNRIKAVVNLDGPLYGSDAMQPINQPLMCLIGSLKEPTQAAVFSGKAPFHQAFFWRWHFNQLSMPQLNAFMSSLYSDTYKITIEGIVHDTFSDAVLNPDAVIAKWLIDGNTAHGIIHSYVGAFFDKYLKGVDSSLLQETVSAWSNVSVEKR